MAEALFDWEHRIVPESHIPSAELPEGWAAYPGQDGCWKPVSLSADPETGIMMVLWRRMIIITGGNMNEADDDSMFPPDDIEKEKTPGWN